MDTHKQKQAADQAMYDHLDIFGWTRPAIYFLKSTQLKLTNTLEGEQAPTDLTNGDNAEVKFLDDSCTDHDNHLGIA